jgi:hypothetical protein
LRFLSPKSGTQNVEPTNHDKPAHRIDENCGEYDGVETISLGPEDGIGIKPDCIPGPNRLSKNRTPSTSEATIAPATLKAVVIFERWFSADI